MIRIINESETFIVINEQSSFDSMVDSHTKLNDRI